MWERLAEAGIPYTRPIGKPPRDARGKRRFLDELTRGRLRGMELARKHVLSLAGGGGWDAVLFAEVGATATLFDISRRQLATVRALARDRGTKLRFVQGDMRDLSAFADQEFDIVNHHHPMRFVPDARRRSAALDSAYCDTISLSLRAATGMFTAQPTPNTFSETT